VSGVTYKLYVSPPPTLVREILRELVLQLTQSWCLGFKVAATPADLARPDKLVAYFDEREETLRAADLIRERVRGIPAHGVPFSVPIDPAGLLSWGLDPPFDAVEPTSWRLWLCSELAQAMTDCLPGDRVSSARGRLTTLGIDPDRWELSPNLSDGNGPD
jgi:hypothetical protein